MWIQQIFQTIIILITARQAIQHGRMLEPPSRNSMWRAGFNIRPDYDDSELFCGGIVDQWRRNHGKCGICGDSYSLKPPRPYETGGQFAHNISVRVYRPGAEVDVIIDLVANHMGTFEFSICPRDNPNERETEECFVPLKVNGLEKYILREHRKGIFTMGVQLPRELKCDHCVFRWHWKSANNWGVCSDGSEAVGCGPQETYRNCADIIVSYEHGIRGMNFHPPPSSLNEFDRIVEVPNNEIPKDDFITFHPVHWPQHNHSLMNSTIHEKNTTSTNTTTMTNHTHNHQDT